MNVWLLALLAVGAAIMIGITLAIARNPDDKNYSNESSFRLLTVMYIVVVPATLVIIGAVLLFIL
ncbi:hypothetical protein HUG20_15665 [Salicibibacter cibi]|uniref:BshB3 potential contributor to bacillithiol synthesis n=1 Tax=Salicibibacter cibi TaxID=2743001 RepID=A0A7T7CGH0_9BACI|nr:hypothetical protein [Salicibibacter cibi]QQK81197.1 hypothetical protein HUG20_15665 [Salicibibacter cibi]